MRFLTRVFNPADIDPENRGTAMLLAGLGLLVILAIALIGYGYYNDRIKPKHETVFTVGGRSYSYADLEHRVDSEIKSGAFDTSDLQNSISSLVLKMQTEELTRLTAKGKGITATDRIGAPRPFSQCTLNTAPDPTRSAAPASAKMRAHLTRWGAAAVRASGFFSRCRRSTAKSRTD